MARPAHMAAQLSNLDETEAETLLAGLTEEEIAGLSDDTVTDDVPADSKAGDEADDAPAPKPKPKKDEPPQSEIEDEDDEHHDDDLDLSGLPEGDDDDEDDPADIDLGTETPADDDDDEELAGMEIVLLDTSVPPDVKSRLKAIEDELDEAATDAEEGRLSYAEHRAKTKALGAEASKLQETVNAANTNFSINQTEWYRLCRQFLKANPNLQANDSVMQAMDNEVRRLQRQAQTSTGTIFDPRILIEARNNLLAQAAAITGQPLPRKAKGEAKPAPAAKPAPRVVKPRRDPPPTLGGLPAADISETSNPLYLRLDRMSATDREDAMSRMTEAQRDRYLQQG